MNDKKRSVQREDNQFVTLYRNLEFLDNFTLEMSQYLDLDPLLEKALHKILADFDIPAGAIYLLRPESKELIIQAYQGLSDHYIGSGVIPWGKGLAGLVASTGGKTFLGVLTGDDHVDKSLLDQEKLASYAGIPLICNATVLGVLELYTKVPRMFSQDEQALLYELGQRIGRLVKNARKYRDASTRALRYATISRIIAVTRQLIPLDTMLQDMSKVLVQTLGFDQAWIGLLNSEQNFVEGYALFGQYFHSSARDLGFSYTAKKKDHPAASCIQKQQSVIYDSVDELPDGTFKSWFTQMQVRSCGFFPILSGEHCLGVMAIYNVGDHEIEEEDVKTLESVADQAGIAIENVRLYDQIKTSEIRYRTLIEAVGNSLMIVDEKDQFLLVNHAFENLSGYKRKDLIGKKSITDFLKEVKGQKSESLSAINYSAETGEGQFIGADGAVKHVYITRTELPGANRKLLSIIDVTQLRELERRLYRSEELASIGELSAGIAHEIRNPLVAITTSVSLLRDEPNLSEEGQQLLDVVKEESDHLAAIVEDFLKFARPKKPCLEYEDINQIIRDVIKRYRDWNENEVKWIEHYDPGVPQVLIDHHQIQQVLTNLIVNSLDSMEGEGQLTISTCEKERTGELWSVVQVEDSGCGIPEDELSKIFQPFFSTKEKGTGMGLAICRRIINEHKGDILVESVPGKGTSFYVYLPIKPSNE